MRLAIVKRVIFVNNDWQIMLTGNYDKREPQTTLQIDIYLSGILSTGPPPNDWFKVCLGKWIAGITWSASLELRRRGFSPSSPGDFSVDVQGL